METVRVVEVGPRDGLQNEPYVVPTGDKVAFVTALAEAGCRDIEVASFVRADRVPQMADAAEVLAALPDRPGVRYIALTPNEKGLERALGAGAKAIAVFTAASETFNRENVGRGIDESLAEFARMVPAARAADCWVRGYVSTAFVCPYEGKVSPDRVVPVVEALLALGVDEVSVGDTLGHAEPDDVAALTEALLPVLPLPHFAYHLHDTRGTALANVARALEYGVRIFDSSATGLGGCPFAPGAEGNVATESLVALLESRGFATGIDAARVAEAGRRVRRGL
ncbi:MAG TPA: hydroxymethylglutaryl-CoA lyase [Armatimonadaceae bacterium]|nr:hydroxymethylglutaryl-CoA lyase [Armatimonadaceae bacterium]